MVKIFLCTRRINYNWFWLYGPVWNFHFYQVLNAYQYQATNPYLRDISKSKKVKVNRLVCLSFWSLVNLGSRISYFHGKCQLHLFQYANLKLYQYILLKNQNQPNAQKSLQNSFHRYIPLVIRHYTRIVNYLALNHYR